METKFGTVDYEVNLTPFSDENVRDVVVREGVDGLGDVSLIESFLNTATPRSKSINKSRAEGIIERLPRHTISDADICDLVEAGFSKREAAAFISVTELTKRSQAERVKMSDKEGIKNSQAIANTLMSEIGDKKQEHLVALFLDTQNRVIEQRTIFIGGLNRSIATPREILHYAVRRMAASVIVSHNHPSGNVNPSPNDDRFTKHLEDSCSALGIVFLDHIVVSSNRYYSYREENRI